MKIRKAKIFTKWLDSLRNMQARSRILARLLLLIGGDKSTQSKDIKTALRLARNLEEDENESEYSTGLKPVASIDS